MKTEKGGCRGRLRLYFKILQILDLSLADVNVVKYLSLPAHKLFLSSKPVHSRYKYVERGGLSCYETYFLIKLRDFSYVIMKIDYECEESEEKVSKFSIIAEFMNLKPLSLAFFSSTYARDTFPRELYIFDYYFHQFSFFITHIRSPASIHIHASENINSAPEEAGFVLCESAFRT